MADRPLGEDRKSASHGEAGYARRPADAYFSEEWLTTFLIDHVDFGGPDKLIWEPAAGDGRMANPLLAAGYDVVATDLFDYGYCESGVDFLHCQARPCDHIVTNPPFDLARKFISRALEITRPRAGMVAILQRHEFDAPSGNHPLFEPPFFAKLILPRRPRWVDAEPGEKAGSPRFPFSWFLWDWQYIGPPQLLFPRRVDGPDLL